MAARVRKYDPTKRRAHYLRMRAANDTRLSLWARKTGLNKILKVTGTSRDEYDAALLKQEGKCAVCGEAPQYGRRLSVDHDHVVGGFRGLLCTHCNLALGHLFDNLECMLKAAEYVRAYRASKNS